MCLMYNSREGGTLCWAPEPPTALAERCRDRDGDFLTHLCTFRQCRWLNRNDVNEKGDRNCGATEIGLCCLESCPCGDKTMQVTVENEEGSSRE